MLMIDCAFEYHTIDYKEFHYYYCVFVIGQIMLLLFELYKHSDSQLQKMVLHSRT